MHSPKTTQAHSRYLTEKKCQNQALQLDYSLHSLKPEDLQTSN